MQVAILGATSHIAKNIVFYLSKEREKLDRIFSIKWPALIEFDVGENTVVYPKLEVNMPIEDLNPRLPAEELQHLMLIDKR
jgi:hypothetical protein